MHYATLTGNPPNMDKHLYCVEYFRVTISEGEMQRTSTTNGSMGKLEVNVEVEFEILRTVCEDTTNHHSGHFQHPVFYLKM
jgi:hypothetical protein